MEDFHRSKKNPCFIIWFLIFLPAFLSAYRKDLIFSYLGGKDGLSQNSVNLILKDRDGFMWFATFDGLNRYDGRKFTVYRFQVGNSNSLSNNSVSALIEDASGNLLIGTSGRGLNHFARRAERFTHFRHNPGDPGSIGSDVIISLCMDPRGNLWIATDRGLDRLPPGTNRFEHIQTDLCPEPSGQIPTISFVLADRQGTVWAGLADRGLLKVGAVTGANGSARSDPADQGTLASDVTNCGSIAPDGTIWIGHDRGLISRLDPQSGVVTRVLLRESTSRIRCLSIDSHGNVWAGLQDGIAFLNQGTGEQVFIRSNPRIPATLTHNSVSSIYVDDTDILWVGASTTGINKCNLKAKRFVNYTHDPVNVNSLGFEFVRGVYENSEGMVYVGGEGMLDQYNPKTETWRHFSFTRPPWVPIPLRENNAFFFDSEVPTVYAICPNSDAPSDLLWIGMNNGGLFQFDQRRLILRPLQIPGFRGRSIYGLYKSSDGILWAATNDGLNQYDTHTRINRYIDLRPFSLQPQKSNKAVDINQVVPDRTGLYWIGSTEDGLFSYDPRTENWRNFQNDPKDTGSLSHNRIPVILETRSGELWIGTYGGGLNRLDRRTGKFERFTTHQGLPNDVVYGLCEDRGGKLWISTNRGLCRFDPVTKTFRSFTDADGLIINEFNSFSYYRVKASGRLYFGGIKGLTTFMPEEIQDDPHPPSVVIEDLKIFNRSIRPGPGSPLTKPIGDMDEIALSYRDSMLTFEFNGLHYVAPAKNRLAYFLEGFDRQWNETDMLRPYATYTNLNPGWYTLRIKAANCDGVWSTTEKKLKIYISPPFWKTWWFILVSSLLSILTLFIVYQNRVRGLKKRKTELEKLVALRTQELREMSLRDPLTGLRNRRFIAEVLKQELISFINSKQFLLHHPHRRKDSTLSTAYGVYMIDIDHFKAVNDAHSHEVGDRFLMQLSDLLCNSIREDDVVVRMGGEEFLVVLKKADPEFLGTFAKKLKDKIEVMEFKLEDGSDGYLYKTCSIGFAAFPFYPGSPGWLNFDHLVTLADLGMMHAKKNGRNLAVRILPGEKLPNAGDFSAFLATLDFGLQNQQVEIEVIK